MIALGIDPAFTTTGLALVEWDGASFRCLKSSEVTTKPRESDGVRLGVIYEAVIRFISYFDVVGIETPYVGKNPSSALKLGMVLGVVKMAFSGAEKVHLFSPAKIKKWACGIGNATKWDMQDRMRVMCAMDTLPSQHVADAIGAAICALIVEGSWSNVTGVRMAT